ncbi:MAG: type II toxin-antitoxin system prevent-host-death family antitoxin [Gammaproteobacteria bacterium]|nr:type II toxin-antitoxin system prevent-host-death family antitoxin [Gammaproteobacteria bacterium]
MSRTITERELRHDAGAILREVKAGNEVVVVTTNGVQLAVLRGVPPQRCFVSRSVIAEAARFAPPVDGRLRAELDAVVDQSVGGRADLPWMPTVISR